MVGFWLVANRLVPCGTFSSLFRSPSLEASQLASFPAGGYHRHIHHTYLREPAP